MRTVNLRQLERRSEDPEARDAEDRAALKSTTTVDSEGIAGIYVYARSHCLRSPCDQEAGRTLLEVGHSSRDVISRFKNQTRATALPEEPVSLGIYVVGDEASNAVERQFHQLLEAADDDRSAARIGDTEWFLTSLRFLDVIAQTLSLPVTVANDPEAADWTQPSRRWC